MSFSSSPIAHVKWVGTGTTASTGVDTSGADLLVISIGWYPAIDTMDAPTDSKSGNTWTAIHTGPYGQGTQNMVERMWYCIPANVGSGHTFTFNTHAGGAVFAAAQMTAWSGAKQSGVLDVQSGHDGGASNVSTLTAGSVTPSQNNSLIITGLGHEANSGAAASIGNSFTISDESLYAAGANESGAQAYLIQGTAGAINPTWNITNAALMATAIAVFKPATTSVAEKSAAFCDIDTFG